MAWWDSRKGRAWHGLYFCQTGLMRWCGIPRESPAKSSLPESLGLESDIVVFISSQMRGTGEKAHTAEFSIERQTISQSAVKCK